MSPLNWNESVNGETLVVQRQRRTSFPDGFTLVSPDDQEDEEDVNPVLLPDPTMPAPPAPPLSLPFSLSLLPLSLPPPTPVPMPVPPVHIRIPILITSPTHSNEDGDDDDIESTTPLVDRKSIHRVIPSPPPSIHSFLSKLTHAHPPHPPPPPPHDFDEDEELDVYVYVPPTSATTFAYQTCCPSISTQAPTPAFDPLWVGPATAANYGLAVRENKHRNDCAQWISLYEHICTGR